MPGCLAQLGALRDEFLESDLEFGRYGHFGQAVSSGELHGLPVSFHVPDTTPATGEVKIESMTRPLRQAAFDVLEEQAFGVGATVTTEVQRAFE